MKCNISTYDNKSVLFENVDRISHVKHEKWFTFVLPMNELKTKFNTNFEMLEFKSNYILKHDEHNEWKFHKCMYYC